MRKDGWKRSIMAARCHSGNTQSRKLPGVLPDTISNYQNLKIEHENEHESILVEAWAFYSIQYQNPNSSIEYKNEYGSFVVLKPGRSP